MRIPQPATKEQANAGGFEPWPVGDYDFEVHDAADDVSDAGNEQIKLTLYVFNEEGRKRTVFDYLPSSEKSQWKVRHFAEAVGLIRSYEAGELDVNDIVEKTGKLKLGFKKATAQYPANNQVADYIPRGDEAERATRPAPARPAPAARPAAARQATSRANDDLSDDIPF